MPKEPLISFVLASNGYETIRPVIECLLRQTVKELLEVVLVTPSAEDMSPALAHREQFAAINIVQDPVADLATARAAGVRAVTAPFLFIGETHSFPHPELAEIILDAFANTGSACVVPAFYNANPQGALSWSGYILDYGRWAEGLPAGEIKTAPIYNAAYRSPILLDLGDELSSALGQSDELARRLTALGQRTLFDSRARIGHVNVSRPWPWVMNRLLGGNLIAANRSRQWSVARRVAYVGGAFLIPIVLLRRLLLGIRQTVRGKRLPLGTLPAILIGLILRAAGEALGYAGLLCGRAARGMHQYELHKLEYAGPRTT